MFNLLSNAVKFTPDGGAVTVEGQKKGKELIITVADSGIGIVAGGKERIFEEFHHVDSGVMGKTSGTGLGLPLAKRMGEKHGGRIWVESEGEGKGQPLYLYPAYP